jgi:hypothetical protein
MYNENVTYPIISIYACGKPKEVSDETVSRDEHTHVDDVPKYLLSRWKFGEAHYD